MKIYSNARSTQRRRFTFGFAATIGLLFLASGGDALPEPLDADADVALFARSLFSLSPPRGVVKLSSIGIASATATLVDSSALELVAAVVAVVDAVGAEVTVAVAVAAAVVVVVDVDVAAAAAAVAVDAVAVVAVVAVAAASAARAAVTASRSFLPEA